MSSTPESLFWGKDPLFRSNVKLYIGDVVTMEPVENFDSVFLYNGHPVTKVDVMGIVVSVDLKAKFSSYVLDDGTGTIFCTYWPKDKQEQFDDADIPTELKQLVENTSASAEEYCVGTALHVRGKLRRYQGATEISAMYIRKMTDPYEELNRMMELPTLYRECYDKSPKQTEPTHLERKASTQISFNRFILEHFTREKLSTVNAKTLCSDKQLSSAFWEQQEEKNPPPTDDTCVALIEKALVNLEQDGVLFRFPGSSCEYTFAPLATELQGQISRELREGSSDTGLSNRRLLQQLKKHVQYSELSLQALNTALSIMESTSDVISVAENCYITFC